MLLHFQMRTLILHTSLQTLQHLTTAQSSLSLICQDSPDELVRDSLEQIITRCPLSVWFTWFIFPIYCELGCHLHSTADISSLYLFTYNWDHKCDRQRGKQTDTVAICSTTAYCILHSALHIILPKVIIHISSILVNWIKTVNTLS